MTEEEFCEFIHNKNHKEKKLNNYKKEIKDYLIISPHISCNKILNQLIIKHIDLKVSEKTVFNYVQQIREEYSIPKTKIKAEKE